MEIYRACPSAANLRGYAQRVNANFEQHQANEAMIETYNRIETGKLEITDVRVEKLKHIPRSGIIVEGYSAAREATGGQYDPFLWYRKLWVST